MSFKKGLSPKFAGALQELATTQSWWRDVLEDPTLVIAIREESLNVYWQGQSLFLVRMSGDSVVASTHQKYLVDPALAAQVLLHGDKFEIETLRKAGFIEAYAGKNTLNKMKRAAGIYAQDEKRGVHTITLQNKNVIDVEIAFSAIGIEDAGSLPRADICALEDGPDGTRLVFWEAKLFANSEIRAKGEETMPPVLSQVQKYKSVISAHRQSLVEAYTRVASDLVAIEKMSAGARTYGPLIHKVASGGQLTVSSDPDVGLLIYDFSAGDKAEPTWKLHLAKIEAGVGKARVKAAGDPKNIRI
jgi:hypothetical protein